MASSAHKDPDHLREHHDNRDSVQSNARLVAGCIRRARHLLVFTGAGISTSAGIPDFRGPSGVWTLRARGKEPSFTTSTLQAVPTLTHMSLVELQQRSVLKYLVSQNCDGLHRRSGILPERISELHGNNDLEKCKRCGIEYLRDFRATAPGSRDLCDHRTGRRCAVCRGELHDSIIHFGEDLSQAALDSALENAEQADVCLVLGSSLTVTPANEVPAIVGRRRKATLIICNLQKTPLDVSADVRIFAETDAFMERLMHHLGFEIPPFVLTRRLSLNVQPRPQDRGYQITLQGVDAGGIPASFLRSARIARTTMRTEPFTFSLRGSFGVDTDESLEVELEFMGHYGEPNVVLRHAYSGEGDGKTMYLLHYHVQVGEWKIERA